jgi:hypothetical protein
MGHLPFLVCQSAKVAARLHPGYFDLPSAGGQKEQPKADEANGHSPSIDELVNVRNGWKADVMVTIVTSSDDRLAQSACAMMPPISNLLFSLSDGLVS